MKQPVPVFLVYRNYHTIPDWNRSTFFGISARSSASRWARSQIASRIAVWRRSV
jgi:membrane-bound lytic murein transglycosylase B